MTNKIPKIVSIDDVFEFDADHLDDVKTVSLTLWRSKDAFDAVHYRTTSLYDGFGVDLRRSLASQKSETRDAA